MNVRESGIRPLAAIALLGLTACATGAPRGAHDFDDSAGRAEIAVLGDGFVRLDGQRVPLEAGILSLRQRFRAMPRADRARFVVELWQTPIRDDAAIRREVAAGSNRLLDEFQIMGVLQSEVRSK
ncbi:MAG: hypothetical protein NXI31_13665 [bacterium]|nr:hypothetical protein [bacterium]